MSVNSVDPPKKTQPLSTGPSAGGDEQEAKVSSNTPPLLSKRNDLHRDLTFVDVPIEKIRIAEQQVRKPSNRQVSRVKRSIETFGVCGFPLLDQENCMIDGHAIVEAARQLGLKSIRCIVLQDCTELERRVLSIALNRLQ